MQILGSAALIEDVQNKELCVNCGTCVGQCPYFKSYRGKLTMLFDCSMQEGRCHAHCPKTEADYDEMSTACFNKPYDGEPLGHYLVIRKGRAGEKIAGKGGFQNGGAVSALIACAMETGMIDAAALTDRDGLIPVPFLATSVDDVLKCSASKYMAASTVATVNEYTAEGKENLGIVGTPCQLTGVARLRMNPTNRDDFYDPVSLSIGLFCTWAVDTRKFADLVSKKTDPSAVTGMDVPPPPASVMELTANGEKIEIPLDDIRDIVPGGCAICPDMTAEFSDISVGALEGDSGYNTLIVRTDRGMKLIETAVTDGWLEVGDIAAESVENLTRGAAGKKKRALEKAQEMNLLNTAEENGRSAIIMKPAVVEKIMS